MKLELPDNLERIIEKNGPAYITFLTFRDACKKFFDLKHLPLIQNNDVKRALRSFKETDPNRSTSDLYPYAYYSVSGLGVVRDGQPLKGLARASAGYTVDEVANATVKKAYLFPAAVTIEFHYVTNDLMRAIDFSSVALIVGQTGKLNSRVQFEGTEWTVEIKMDSESIPFPRTDKDNEVDPEAFDLVISFTVNSRIGRVRAVPKINNYGRVTQNVEVKGHEST